MKRYTPHPKSLTLPIPQKMEMIVVAVKRDFISIGDQMDALVYIARVAANLKPKDVAKYIKHYPKLVNQLGASCSRLMNKKCEKEFRGKVNRILDDIGEYCKGHYLAEYRKLSKTKPDVLCLLLWVVLWYFLQ